MSKVLLIVLDGFGEGKKYKWNAVYQANTPFLDQINRKYKKALIKTSGEAVGLPKRTMGGSEVGHYTMGAGRVIFQKLEEINRSIKNKSFFKNKAFLSAIKNCKKYNSVLHLLGMISDAGVHSHIEHLFALMALAKQQGLNKIFIHAVADGRDVPEKSAEKFIKKILKKIKELGVGEIATICGRYYSMDRDKNFNRTKKAYELMAEGKGFEEKSPLSAIKNAYSRGDETDYYIKPIILNKNGIVKDKDSIIFFNFRTDRARQLTEAFVENNFQEFKRKKLQISFICMGGYSDKAPVAFPEPVIKNNLGEILSANKKTQLRIAETEKYAHITFFFNSQKHKINKGETRILIPSPKVRTYAEKPEMSAFEVTKKVIIEIKKEKYDFILLNFANADLVGHSGDFKATKKCIEVLDKCLKHIVPEAQNKGYEIILTADHGNAEHLKYKDGTDCASHTLNPVPCFIISDKFKLKNRKGELCQIAPTVLKILSIKKPKEMQCKPLI